MYHIGLAGNGHPFAILAKDAMQTLLLKLHGLCSYCAHDMYDYYDMMDRNNIVVKDI